MRQPYEYENPACYDLDPNLFIEETKENTPTAINICRQCQHQTECANYGINVMVIGVWGGLTTQQRADLAKKANIIREQIFELPRPHRGKNQNDTYI